jgi:spore coat protein CotF
MAVEIAVPQSGQLPQVKGPEMNDRDWMNDVLSSAKYLTTSYNTALNEMQCPKLHTDIQNILIDTHKCQWDAFNLMFQKGWYKMKAADQQDIMKTKTQFEGYRSQFPSF